jgi:beta-aspartyl-peptidase (threonine type)
MKSALAIHGGAGTIHKSEMTPELEREYRGGLDSALRAGWEVLSRKGSALDAVEAAVASLENFPLFNAGRGSVFTHAGKNEMDACIMDGAMLKSGAVAFVSNVRNPILLARRVMEETEHCLLAGDGAIEFAHQCGVAFEPDEYFFTEHRWRQLQAAITENRVRLDHSGRASDNGTPDRPKYGTVGAVACDANGNLAAATSTGGMTNKKFGRVGDTPIIGAGTYAENSTCAVSCTGHGEFFMLGVTAYDLAARMKYKGLSLDDASCETLAHLTTIGGEGGFVAADRFGNVVMPFNSEGMYRGRIDGTGTLIGIFR